MPKILTGKVVSTKMKDTVVVETSSFRVHPIYKKRIKKDRKIKADSSGFELHEGDKIKIVQIKPISKEKHFKVLEVIK